MSKKRSNKKSQEEFKLELQPENPQAKRMMWIGISVFLFFTIIIWGWSMKVKIDNLKLQTTPESNLIQKSKQEWNAIFYKDTTTSTTNVKIVTSTTSTVDETDIVKDYLEKIITSTTPSSTNN